MRGLAPPKPKYILPARSSQDIELANVSNQGAQLGARSSLVPAAAGSVSAQRTSSSSSSCSSSSSASSSSSDSEDEDNPFVVRPLAPWLLQDLAAADLSSEREYDASFRADPSASSHTEVSIEIASVDDDSTDASLLSVRSAASLEDFSENLSNAPEAPSRGSGSDEINMADMRRQAMLEMNQLRWTAMRQQAHASYNTGSELHRQGKVNEAVQHLKSALESAREAHDATLEALVLSRLGLVCNRAGKHGKAIELFKAALRSVKRALPPESAVMQQIQSKTLHEADAAQLLHAAPAAGRGGGGGGERGGGGARGDITQRCTCETVDESTSTSTCLLALQGLTQAYMKTGQTALAAAAERQALDLLPRAQAQVGGVGAGKGSVAVGGADAGEVRRRMATIVRRRLAEAQAAIPVVCRGLMPLAATGTATGGRADESAQRAQSQWPLREEGGGGGCRGSSGKSGTRRRRR